MNLTTEQYVPTEMPAAPPETDAPGGKLGLILLAVTVFFLAVIILGDLLAVFFR